MTEQTKNGLRLFCDSCHSPMKRVSVTLALGKGPDGAQCVNPGCDRFFAPETGHCTVTEVDHADPQPPTEHNSNDSRCPVHSHWLGVGHVDLKTGVLTYICVVEGCDTTATKPSQRAVAQGSGS